MNIKERLEYGNYWVRFQIGWYALHILKWAWGPEWTWVDTFLVDQILTRKGEDD